MCIRIEMFTDQHYCISTGSCLTIIFKTLISLRATTTCLPTCSSGCDYRASTVMSYWKFSKRGWAHWLETSLTKADKTYSAIQMLQFRLWVRWKVANVSTILYIINFISHSLSLIAHRRWLSEYASYVRLVFRLFCMWTLKVTAVLTGLSSSFMCRLRT